MSSSQSHIVFVYGTLRRGYGGVMSNWLARYAGYLGAATVRGRLYDTGSYPALVTSSRPDERVAGDLYLLSKPQQLAKLDRFEGIGPGQRRPYEYRRDWLDVTDERGERLGAWVYVYAWSTNGLRRISGGDYLKRCRRGG
jgi:gamma-glutamylcyclotransferase (GGCT)/AIG2-like uncharacterized protein YtfP